MDDVESLLPTWVTVQSFHGFGACTEVEFCSSSSICTAALSKKLHHQSMSSMFRGLKKGLVKKTASPSTSSMHGYEGMKNSIP